MSNLLEEEQRNSYNISTKSPKRSVDTSVSSNSPQSVCPEIGKDMLDSKDQELLSILKNYKYPTITYHLRDQLILALLELRVIFVPTQCLTSVIGF